MKPDFLSLPDRRLAYQRLIGDPNGPGIVFLGGYASDMSGTKASFLAERCADEDLSFLRFDYRGHGCSSGDFNSCVLGDWLEDACAAFDQLTQGKQILIGSSMGGWLALLLARARPERIKAMIGIAAAPDFTEELVWKNLTEEQKAQLERDGFIPDETSPPDQPFVMTRRLIEEARQHLLLGAEIKLDCPLHLLQGLNDEEVPWRYALRILERVSGSDARVTLIKDGDHRLSRPKDLALLWNAVREFAGV